MAQFEDLPPELVSNVLVFVSHQFSGYRAVYPRLTYCSAVAAAAMQNIATQLSSYLAQYDSKLLVFAFAPDTLLLRASRIDYNGHRWPRYAYLKKTTIDWQGNKNTAAIPFVRFAEEIPGAAILSREQG
jgi:hypothetical protein